MNRKFLLAILCFLVKIEAGFCQADHPDSLIRVLHGLTEDSSKVNLLNAVSFTLKQINPDTALVLSLHAYRISRKLNWTKGEALSFHQLGLINQLQNNSPTSLDYYYKALTIWENDSLWSNKINSYKERQAGKSRTLGNIGALYVDQGNTAKALSFYLKALQISESLNDKKGMAAKFTNIGNLYADQKKSDKALDCYFKAMQLYQALKEKKKVGSSLINIGSVYFDMKNHEKAIANYSQGLKVYQEIGYNDGLAKALGNIATVYTAQKNFARALSFYHKALRISSAEKNTYLKSLLHGNIGHSNTGIKNYAEAEKNLLLALRLSDSISNMTLQKDHNFFLYELYLAKGKKAKALTYFVKFTVLKDSLFGIEKSRDITRHEMNYEFEKMQLMAKIEQDKKDALVKEREVRQKIIIYSVSTGLLLVLVLVVLIYKGYRSKQRANMVLKEKNLLIVEQKKLVEEKQKEIIASIRYAQRIQKALITPEKYIEKQIDRLKKY